MKQEDEGREEEEEEGNCSFEGAKPFNFPSQVKCMNRIKLGEYSMSRCVSHRPVLLSSEPCTWKPMTPKEQHNLINVVIL